MTTPHAAPLLTASQVQHRTTSRRLLGAHPWTAHVLVVALVLLVGAATALAVSETVRGATSLGLFSPGPLWASAT